MHGEPSHSEVVVSSGLRWKLKVYTCFKQFYTSAFVKLIHSVYGFINCEQVAYPFNLSGSTCGL